MKNLSKTLYTFLALVLLLNSAALSATLYKDQLAQEEFSTLFGESVFICSGENSFDLNSSDFGKLILELKENKNHNLQFLSDADFERPENYFYIELTSSYIDSSLHEPKITIDLNVRNQSHPRAPPYIFV